jgi:uncharacterized protein (UPF0218 family)
VRKLKRLLSKLEFAYGNVTNGNPTQFGRDMEGFKEQAKSTSQAVRNSIKANQAVIDQKYGRAAQAPAPVVTNNNSATVRVQAPDGSIRLIPANRVESAIKAGGKLVP